MASNRERILVELLLEAITERNQLLIEKQLLNENLASILKENERLTAKNQELFNRAALPGLTRIFDIESDSE